MLEWHESTSWSRKFKPKHASSCYLKRRLTRAFPGGLHFLLIQLFFVSFRLRNKVEIIVGKLLFSCFMDGEFSSFVSISASPTDTLCSFYNLLKASKMIFLSKLLEVFFFTFCQSFELFSFVKDASQWKLSISCIIHRSQSRRLKEILEKVQKLHSFGNKSM